MVVLAKYLFLLLLFGLLLKDTGDMGGNALLHLEVVDLGSRDLFYLLNQLVSVLLRLNLVLNVVVAQDVEPPLLNVDAVL